MADDQIQLSGQLRYKYFDNPKFATISDNPLFIDYIEKGERIGNLIELKFLHSYLDYNGETKTSVYHQSTKNEIIKLIETKKTDPYIDWTALYNYFDELKQIKWRQSIKNDIEHALKIFEPFRNELLGIIQNNQQLWI